MNGRQLLAKVLDVSMAELPEIASIDTIVAWDSLAHMRLVIQLEKTISRELTTDEMLALDGVDAIDYILKSSSGTKANRLD